MRILIKDEHIIGNRVIVDTENCSINETCDYWLGSICACAYFEILSWYMDDGDTDDDVPMQIKDAARLIVDGIGAGKPVDGLAEFLGLTIEVL